MKLLIAGREQNEDLLEADSYNLDCCGQKLIEIESLPRRVSDRRYGGRSARALDSGKFGCDNKAFPDANIA